MPEGADRIGVETTSESHPAVHKGTQTTLGASQNIVDSVIATIGKIKERDHQGQGSQGSQLNLHREEARYIPSRNVRAFATLPRARTARHEIRGRRLAEHLVQGQGTWRSNILGSNTAKPRAGQTQSIAMTLRELRQAGTEQSPKSNRGGETTTTGMTITRTSESGTHATVDLDTGAVPGVRMGDSVQAQ